MQDEIKLAVKTLYLLYKMQDKIQSVVLEKIYEYIIREIGIDEKTLNRVSNIFEQNREEINLFLDKLKKAN